MLWVPVQVFPGHSCQSGRQVRKEAREGAEEGDQALKMRVSFLRGGLFLFEGYTWWCSGITLPMLCSGMEW